MAKAIPINEKGKIVGHMIFCPACHQGHAFYNGLPNKPSWQFNGDCEKPTFNPSMLVRGKVYPSGGRFPTQDEHSRMMAGEKLNMTSYICHSFVRNGQMQFLSDCSHELSGQTVDLPEI